MDEWLNVNKYKFVYPPNRRIKERVLEITDYYRDVGRVYALTYAPKSLDRIMISGIIALFAGAIAAVMSSWKKDQQ